MCNLQWLHMALLLSWVVLIRRTAVGHYPQPGARLLACAPVTDHSLLTTSWNSKTQVPCISRGQLHISFYNTHTFPFNHATATTYFHWCALRWEFLIDGQVTICNRNTWYHFAWNFHYVVVTVLDCNIVASAFDLQSLYYTHFRINCYIAV